MDLWSLDGRQFRSNQACNGHWHTGGRILLASHCAELDDTRRSLLGPAQEAWLSQGLVASPRQWKLLAQGTQISGSGIETPLGRTLYTDGWDGYPAARERLLRTVADARLADVVCLGGDVHRHVAAVLRPQPNDARSPVVASEFVTGSVTSQGLSDAATLAMRLSNPDVLHARSDGHGYTLLEVTPERLRCEFRAASFPVAAQARLHAQASFVVERGHAGPQPA